MYLKDLRNTFPPLENSNFVKRYSLDEQHPLILKVTHTFKNMCLIGFRVTGWGAPYILSIYAYDKYGSSIPFMNQYDVYYIGREQVGKWIPFTYPLHEKMIDEYTLTLKIIGEKCEIEILEYPLEDMCPEEYPLVFLGEDSSIFRMYFANAKPPCSRLRDVGFYGEGRKNINFPNGAKIIPMTDRILDMGLAPWQDYTHALICSLPLREPFNIIHVQNSHCDNYSKEESCYNWSI
jgi:hypothetical protein